MYAIYIAQADLWIFLGAIFFCIAVTWWSLRELQRDAKKEREIDALEEAWELTEDPDEGELSS